jgi:hypothetical protein
MLLSGRGDPSSVDFDMVYFGNFDQLTHSYEDAGMGVENEWMDTYFLPVRTLMDLIAGHDCENIEKTPSLIRHQHTVEVPQKVPSGNLELNAKLG